MKKFPRDYILYVGPFSFPNGGAAARRVLGNCQALKKAGFPVMVASGQCAMDFDFFEFHGINVFSLGERNAENFPRWLKRLAYFQMGDKTIQWLDSLEEKPYAIILYSGYTPYLIRLIPWAKRNSVRLIFDAVEWYEPDYFLGYASPYQLNIEFAMRKLIPEIKNIISISFFLNDYFTRAGCRSIKVPPLLDVVNAQSFALQKEVTMQLVYAGSPGKKDLLDIMLEAVLKAKQCGVNVVLSVAGVAPDQSALYPSLKRFPMELVSSTVRFMGILDHHSTMNLVGKSHFSILLRNVARYSKAGFPTKFAESFSLSTPVIANITSDLGEYLIDEVTGFVCCGNSSEDMTAAIIKASKIEPHIYEKIRQNCKARAIDGFDYRQFSEVLGNFVRDAEI